MNKRVIIVSLVAIGLIIATIFKLFSNKKEVAAKIYIHDVNAAVLVETTKPQFHTFDSQFSYLGTFEPNKQATISSEGQGKVVSINFDEGDAIKKGSVIAKLDDEMLRLQLQTIEVNLDGQRKDENRYKILAQQNAAPDIQLEKIELAIRGLEIQKAQILKQIKGCTIVSPFNGVVTKKMIDLGSVIGIGTPVLEVTDISVLKLAVNVPEKDINNFKVGQKVEVNTDVLADQTLEGTIKTISVQADKTHNVKVQVEVVNKSNELRAGMFGTAILANGSSHNALSIPRKTLVGSTKSPQLYVVKNGKALLTPFSAGTSDGDFIEIVSGITEDDKVVIKGQVNLKNNSNVKLK
jgi:RND family efflux transporter MFP subunit